MKQTNIDNNSKFIKEFEFKKYRLKIQLLKWVIGTLGLSIVTLIIDYGFRERAISLNEIQFYDRYVTDLIVLNKKIGPRRFLAQYFANITTSEKLKQGWIDYYNVVNEEYQNILRQDSLIEKKIKYLKNDTLNKSNVIEIDKLQKQRDIYNDEVKTEVQLIPTSEWQRINEQLYKAENYFKSGSSFGKEQALKTYYNISKSLNEYQKLNLSEDKRNLLIKADEAYKNNQVEEALGKYYSVFNNFKY